MIQTTRYQKFKKEIEYRLGSNRLSIHDIYKIIKDVFARECDDSEPCIHRGHFYQDGEWKHEVRNALQGLKKDGLVKYDTRNRTWVLIE